MKKNNLAVSVSVTFIFWIALSNLVLFYFGKSLPVLMTNILSLAYFIFIPITFVLEPLGLVEGQIMKGPTALGLVVGTMIYTGILFGVVSLVSRIKKSP